jgi:hypothetical protein
MVEPWLENGSRNFGACGERESSARRIFAVSDSQSLPISRAVAAIAA